MCLSTCHRTYVRTYRCLTSQPDLYLSRMCAHETAAEDEAGEEEMMMVMDVEEDEDGQENFHDDI